MNKFQWLTLLGYIFALPIAFLIYVMWNSVTFGLIVLAIFWAGTTLWWASDYAERYAMLAIPQVAIGFAAYIVLIYAFFG